MSILINLLKKLIIKMIGIFKKNENIRILLINNKSILKIIKLSILIYFQVCDFYINISNNIS